MDKVAKHFKKVDPILYRAYLKTEVIQPIQKADPKNYFSNLCRSITHQQLSTKVGEIIWKRFYELLNGNVNPKEVLKTPDEKIRKIGLSARKIGYIKDLAQKIVNREILLGNLENISSVEVIEHLTGVKGIGVWTVEMFLMSSLGREDIFSHGDLGLKRAIEKLYGLNNPPKEQVESISIKWAPYRTYASRILWESLN